MAQKEIAKNIGGIINQFKTGTKSKGIILFLNKNNSEWA